MKQKRERSRKPEDFQTVMWPDLEKMAMTGKCPCCADPFSQDMPPEMTSRCHQGPVFVAYWDSWLYFSCGECNEPICKIPVDRRLV